MNTSLALKKERSELEARIRAENVTRAGLWSRLVSPGRVFGQEFKELHERERGAAPALTATAGQIRAVEAELRVARAGGNQARVLVLRARLHELRGEQTDGRATFFRKQVKSLSAGVKDERSRVVAVRRAAGELDDRIDAIQRAVLRDQLDLSAALLRYDQAYFADNHPAMLAGVTRANEVQQRIADQLKELLALKVQLNTLLRDAVTA